MPLAEPPTPSPCSISLGFTTSRSPWVRTTSAGVTTRAARRTCTARTAWAGSRGPRPTAPPDTRAAVELIDHLATRHPDLTVLALGPLTNLAAYAETPGVAAFDRLVIMGGAFGHSGNVTAWAEANIHNDPQAAAVVFAQDWDTTLVPLDVTMTQTLDATDLVRLEAVPGAVPQALAATLPAYLDFYEGGSSPIGAARCTTR